MFNIWNSLKDYVLAAMAALVLTTSIGWYITDLRLDASVAGRKTDKANYEKAQAEAKTLDLERARKKERDDAEKAQKADAVNTALLDKYRDAIKLYKASVGTTRYIYVPSPSGGSELPDRPDQDTLIPVSAEDLDICAVNTARLQTTQDWFNSLGKE